MTAGDVASCGPVGGHRPPLQSDSLKSCTLCAKPLLARRGIFVLSHLMYPVLAIVGPTASGKSELALFLAECFSGEIVNYDSVQIFCHFDIGTAKPTPEERARVPHHMIDIREPTAIFTAGEYQGGARRGVPHIFGP